MLLKVCQQIFFCLRAPQAVVCVHNVSQRGKPRIFRALCPQIGQCGKRHGQVCVDQLFAARNLGQIERSLGCRIQTADMRHHNRRVDAAGGGQLERFDHIRGVAAGRAHNMRGIIMYIIKVHLGRELLVGVDKVQIDAVLLLDLGRREQRLGACQTVLVHIGHNDHGRTSRCSAYVSAPKPIGPAPAMMASLPPFLIPISW